MLSALDLPFQQKLAYDLGAFGYVVKPIRLDEVKHTVKLALDYRRKSCRKNSRVPAGQLLSLAARQNRTGLPATVTVK